MALVSLVYVSVETRKMTENDLVAILESSRKNNAEANITGMLLYRDSYFIQALEGEDKAVNALYDKIAQDNRHRKVLLVGKDRIEQRSYGDWSMGFKNLDGVDLTKVPGYSQYLDEPIEPHSFEKQPSRAKQLLELFRTRSNY